MLVWLYDEHGGWYDHVAPPPAIAPDSIPPKLGSGDVPGGYDTYGVRVPAVVVSGCARPHAVTNVVHDHTSILATIQAKWNLPAMTYRDANATTMADFLDTKVRFPQPPTLAAPSNLAASEQGCDPSAPTFQVHQSAPASSPPTAHRSPQRVLVTYSVGHAARRLVVELRVNRGALNGLVVELLRGKRVLARGDARHVGVAQHTTVLRPSHGHRFTPGRYELVVRHGPRTLAKRGVIIA
jgi:phospholipase C